MIDLIEVFDRAEIGPLTSETDYYMKRYVPKLAEVIARHKVKWDKETIINTDDALTDARVRSGRRPHRRGRRLLPRDQPRDAVHA